MAKSVGEAKEKGASAWGLSEWFKKGKIKMEGEGEKEEKDKEKEKEEEKEKRRPEENGGKESW